MPFQEVVIHTNQGLFSVPPGTIESHPPIEKFQLAEDLSIIKLKNVVADKIMEYCEPHVYGTQHPMRQFAQLYAFVRTGPVSESLWGWKRDDRLELCVALSRLVHPTSVSLTYHAQINVSHNGDLTQVIPIDSGGNATGAWIAQREGPDWLTETQAAALRELVSRLPLKFRERLHRALFYNELAARNYYADVRWTLIATALEALIHTEVGRSTFQFKTRSAKLATAVGVTDFTEESAGAFYHLRSQIAHGQGVGELSAEDYRVYRAGEDVLRAVLTKSILDPAFAATFTDEETIRTNWAKQTEQN